MATYSGTITTSGKSEAIRLEKALFKSHPEFARHAKVHAHVIAPGTMLVSVADQNIVEADPVRRRFLAFWRATLRLHLTGSSRWRRRKSRRRAN